MAIIVPTERRIICHNDEDYSLPINVLDERMLRIEDEELMMALAEYKPRTKFKENDFVILTSVPSYLRDRETLPRCWKIRFVITRWAYELMTVILQYGGAISVAQATTFLESMPSFDPRRMRDARIYAHGYPHGDHPDSTAWLPEALLRRTTFKETAMQWVNIVEEAGAKYRGYDTNNLPSRFVLDLAPDNYKDGANLRRPFVSEEPLVHTLCKHAGLDEILAVPYVIGEYDHVKQLDRDHDIFATAED
jgi:hypothetical protein